MVAPGCRDSRDSWLCLSVWEVNRFRIAHLYRPPPITCIHLTVYPLCLLIVHIVPLRGKNQVPCELWISIDRADAIQDIPKMKLEVFVSNENVLTLERWAARQIIDDRVEIVYGMV